MLGEVERVDGRRTVAARVERVDVMKERGIFVWFACYVGVSVGEV